LNFQIPARASGRNCAANKLQAERLSVWPIGLRPASIVIFSPIIEVFLTRCQIQTFFENQSSHNFEYIVSVFAFQVALWTF
jgi:hypothetical protein